MKKKIILFALLISIASNLKAQQYALFGTRTLFDSFENPAIKAFTLDSSGKFASNFLLPNFGFNAANKGDANAVIRKLSNEGKLNTVNLSLGEGNLNTVYQNSNIYLLTFRIFNSYKYNQEIGFAWQIRSDTHLDYTNESLAIFDSYKRFSEVPYTNIFNNNGYQQTYHQFSVSIRENLDKRLAFGAKFSLLSGIGYNSLKINDSYIFVDAMNDRLDIGLNGIYKGTFINENELDKETLIPTFKNPGLSISLGTTYQSKSGYFIMGNVKDLGFIHWNNESHQSKFNELKSIYNLSNRSTKSIRNELTDIANDLDERKGFYTATNAKADFLIAKTFNFYKPSLIISKNLFYPGGDIALVNTFNFNKLSASVTPTYNFNNFMMLGLQGMYKTPNFEFFLGTDNISKSISLANGLIQKDGTIGSGSNGGSFYVGLGIKFGKTVNHPQNLSTMPGVNGEKTYKGFFRSMYELFKKPSF